MESSKVAVTHSERAVNTEASCFKETNKEEEKKGSRRMSWAKINVPLLPVKVAIFFWYGGCRAMAAFNLLYLKQTGLTVKELSIIFMILPVIQLFAPTLCGILADKYGRTRPVIQANLILTLIAANSMLFIHGANENSGNRLSVTCHAQTVNKDSLTQVFDVYAKESRVGSCRFNCSEPPSLYINDTCFENYVVSCNFSFLNDIWPQSISDNELAVTRTNTSSNVSCAEYLENNCSLTCERNMSTGMGETNFQHYTRHYQRFILALILLITYHTSVENANRILDATVMSMVKTYNSDFGRQRLWALVGTMVCPPLAGLLISAFSKTNGSEDYRVAFYVFDCMVLVAMLIVWKLDIKMKPPGQNMLKNATQLIKNPDVFVLMITITISGTAWGFRRIFSIWFLKDLGASSTLIGLLVSLGGFVSLPFLFTSKWFIKKLGCKTLLLLCLIGNVTWFTGYSYLTNPWWALVYQLLRTIFYLFWVSVVEYSHMISPPGMTSTVISTAGGLHFGIGRGSASLIGGLIMSKHGGKTAHRVMAAVCAATAVLYALYLYYRSLCKPKEKQVENTDISTATLNVYVLPSSRSDENIKEENTNNPR